MVPDEAHKLPICHCGKEWRGEALQPQIDSSSMNRPPSSLLANTLWLFGLLVLPVSAIADEREPASFWFEQRRDRAWLENYDPTLFSRRVFSEFTYENQDDDKDFYKVETSLRWDIPVREDLALGMQVTVPVKWNETATSSDSGIGDIEFRTGFIGRFSPTLRYGIGVNGVIESASDEALSSHAFILRPILALRWDASDRLNLGTNVEYNVTPLDEGAYDVSALELKFPVALKISDAWSSALTYKPRWNFVSEDDRNRLELVATYQWGSRRQYAVSFGGECPLTSESLDYKLLTSLAWYF